MKKKQKAQPKAIPVIREGARLLIDHPHSHRDWEIVSPDEVSGFWILRSEVKLGGGDWATFELTLHESEFERLCH